MSRTVIVLLGLVTASLTAQPSSPEGGVTLRGLLHEMTDLAGLAELPASSRFTCRQFSSYDRASVSPEEGWFANRDVGQFIRVEERNGRREHVMMDAEGPGAIVRIWSANPKGTLRIYLDGSETPALEAPMADLLGGRLPGIPRPVAGERSRGWNSYLPIPYAKRCVITSDTGGFYYHVNYRTYEPETEVSSFTLEELSRLAGPVQETARRLEDPASLTRPAGGQITRQEEVLEPGEVLRLERAGSPGAIVELRIHVQASRPDLSLRTLLLTGVFDGEETITSPLGDFFGAAPGVNPYASLPLGVEPDGVMWCRWVMPYERSAQLTIRNAGTAAARVSCQLATVPRSWTVRSMHFRARWRTELDVPTRPMQDWNYLRAEGPGVFVGVAFCIANPVKAWWGEGDEKIYVDGESFPSHFGTGTEDYYGYAWGCNRPFSHAYHNQPRCDGPGSYGHTALNRWHIMDRIPFEESIRFDMELWHWHETCRVTMSVVAYWYARPGGRDGFAPLAAGDLVLTELPAYEPPRVEGAIEGEEMRVIESTARVEPQTIDSCSNESHMWWHDGVAVGDRLVLGFPVPESGTYRVLARFLSAADYGIAQMSLNGEPAREAVDLYSPRIAVTAEIDLGTHRLAAGENRIGAVIVGASEHAIKAHFFGLDYLRLVPER